MSYLVILQVVMFWDHCAGHLHAQLVEHEYWLAFFFLVGLLLLFDGLQGSCYVDSVEQVERVDRRLLIELGQSAK